MIDANQLRKILPQAYPFLLIDKVIDFEEGKRLTAIKNITANEWSVLGDAGDPGHFPEVLIIEAAAQAALVLYYLSKTDLKKSESERVFPSKITANFIKSGGVGDELTITVMANKMMDVGGYLDVTVLAASQKLAEVEIIYSVKRWE
ncbi:MAG TPA: 3-hydroxyacyl-[acyl-carrier-protein] dehydratase FabZ [Candidatus Omnitrophota bacterium]|nr:3-hydroxyacyl-[acyl-carrier-protein] dehydratase FabZ [Candidatus Omnitrophota bacterium]HPD85621.1 3-hydroxyacyl-[acyl-carrier-protein] dehydratase FabZ [Candidatus Omnitrophota bacterium]HRZ04464.1 3-hydroxyacyl-[acyl-carrier-protein] dehydratase FabZ [Candidatus Omnitrophota bacterium]